MYVPSHFKCYDSLYGNLPRRILSVGIKESFATTNISMLRFPVNI